MSGRFEIKLIGDTVRSLATSRREDCSDAVVAKCGVEIFQPLVVGSGEIAGFSKRMGAVIDCQTPLL